MKIANRGNMGICLVISLRIFVSVTPDYPQKPFSDERNQYCLLMEVLAMGN